MMRPRASRRISSAVTTRSWSGSWASLARMPHEHLVRLLGQAEAVQTDHEDMAETRLVRGVRGLQRQMGGVRRGVVQTGETSAVSASERSAGARS